MTEGGRGGGGGPFFFPQKISALPIRQIEQMIKKPPQKQIHATPTATKSLLERARASSIDVPQRQPLALGVNASSLLPTQTIETLGSAVPALLGQSGYPHKGSV